MSRRTWIFACLAALLGMALGPRAFGAAPSQTAPSRWDSTDPLVVEVDPTGPRDRASVRAANASLERVVGELARRTGRVVEGLTGPGRNALVTVELIDRPVEQILEFVLGSAGMRAELRPGLLRVLPDDSETLSPERLRERALALYLRSTMEHPDHPAAERGRLSQGAVEEARGNLSAALEHYQTLIEFYPESPLHAEAHLRSGSALERLGRFAEAANEYRVAASGEESAPQHAPAKLGLARCRIELGNPDLAEIMIDMLDDAIPPSSRAEAAERGLVRAQAQVLREEFVEALATLDQLDRLGQPDSTLARSMELRAMAFEGLDLYREASRFWLVHARQTTGERSVQAFERAAQLAVEDDDPLGVLFVAAEAERAGSPAALGRMARAARLELGLLVDLEADDVTDVERVEVAEGWVAEGKTSAARPVLADLHARRTELLVSLRPRTAVAWARCLYAEDGLENALAALREARPAISDHDQRQPLDLLAAELLEGERQFTRAMAAYEGRY
jgi:tetratricopeptide (TPR) repeat protein